MVQLFYKVRVMPNPRSEDFDTIAQARQRRRSMMAAGYRFEWWEIVRDGDVVEQGPWTTTSTTDR